MEIDKFLSILWGMLALLDFFMIIIEPTNILRWALFVAELALCINLYELFKVKEENKKLKNETRIYSLL